MFAPVFERTISVARIPPDQMSSAPAAPIPREAEDVPARQAATGDAEEGDPWPGELDVGEGDEEGAGARKRKASEKQRQWTSLAGIQETYFEATSKLMPLDRLAWDVNLEHGQSRTVDDAHVEQLVASLTRNPPLEPVTVTLWNHEGENKMYILSGQHVCKALQRVRDERMTQALPIPDWQQLVKAHILKYATPLDVRRTVSGADNAAARMVRQTSVHEVMASILGDKSRDDVNTKIQNHLEFHGMLEPDTQPVCTSNDHAEKLVIYTLAF